MKHCYLSYVAPFLSLACTFSSNLPIEAMDRFDFSIVTTLVKMSVGLFVPRIFFRLRVLFTNHFHDKMVPHLDVFCSTVKHQIVHQVD